MCVCIQKEGKRKCGGHTANKLIGYKKLSTRPQVWVEGEVEMQELVPWNLSHRLCSSIVPHGPAWARSDIYISFCNTVLWQSDYWCFSFSFSASVYFLYFSSQHFKELNHLFKYFTKSHFMKILRLFLPGLTLCLACGKQSVNVCWLIQNVLQ